MEKIEVPIPVNITVDISGNPKAKRLWILVVVDKEDSEDTQTFLWRADSEEELKESAKEYFVGDDPDDPGYTAMCEKFEDDWGLVFLYTKIGSIS